MCNRREYEDCCLLGCDAASFDVEDPIFGGTRCLRLQGDNSVKRDQHFEKISSSIFREASTFQRNSLPPSSGR